MNSMEILKAFNDIDDKYLMENNNKEDKKICDEKIKFKVNVKQILNLIISNSVVAITIILVIVMGKNIYVGKNISNIISVETKDEIIINNYMLDTYNTDLKSSYINENLIEKFGLKNKLKIPNLFILGNQCKRVDIMQLENGISSEYEKYNITFVDNKDIVNNYVSIDFSKEELLINIINEKNGKMLNAKGSNINGVNVKIFEIEILNECGKIIGDACFKCNDYNIHINVKGITNEEFIDLIKSVIDAFKELK